MSHRLFAEHNVKASPASISNWKLGRLPRHTSDDRRLVEAMEHLLGLRAGALQLPLDRDREDRLRPTAGTAVEGRLMHGRPLQARPVSEEEGAVHNLRQLTLALAGSDSYVVTSVDERVLIGTDRKEYRRTVRLTVRALNSYTDCYRLVFSPDDGSARSKIIALRNCRRGREVRGERGLSEIELLFDRVLDRGASHTFDYQEVVAHGGAPQCWVRRGVGHSPVDLLRMVVWFEVPPARVWSCRWDGRGTRPVGLGELQVLNHTATLERPRPVPGLHGLTWSW